MKYIQMYQYLEQTERGAGGREVARLRAAPRCHSYSKA